MNEAEQALIDAGEMVKLAENVVLRFWNRVHQNGEGGCWLWNGQVMTDYPRFRIDSTHLIKAHRLAWIIQFGPIPNRLCVCHKCDVKSCCRGDHLFLGTPADNARDRDNKGRHRVPDRVTFCALMKEVAPRGEMHGNAKLNDHSVREIRRRYTAKFGQKAALSREFKVTQAIIARVLKREIWAHVS